MIDRVERETPLEVTAEALWSLQEGDGTLEAVRKAASGEACSGGIGFFKRDGLLFRRWTLEKVLAGRGLRNAPRQIYNCDETFSRQRKGCHPQEYQECIFSGCWHITML